MILILIFAEALGLYGLIVSLILSQWKIQILKIEIVSIIISVIFKKYVPNVFKTFTILINL